MPYIGNQAVVGDSANTFKTLDGIASFTVTFDATDSGVVSIANNTLTFNNHRFVTGQKVTYNDGGGTAIGGLSDGSYFIIKEDQSTIKLASSASNATDGTAIDLTSGAAGGSHTLNIAQDGINTKFKATHSSGIKAKVSRPAQITLSINGVIQQPTADYTIESDSTLVFSSAPTSTDKIFASFIGEVAASFDLSDNTVDEFTANGSLTTFTLSKTVPSSNDLLVTLDGVTQYPTTQSATRAYSVLENVLTFTSAPAAGVIIQVRHIGFAGATSQSVTGFYGRTGNVQLKNTDNVSVNNLTVAGNLDVTGDLTYDETVSRNLNVTGVATVASGIVSTGDWKIGTATTLSQDNIFTTGIITATSFVGSGANLTGVASTENIRTNTNATFLQNVNVSGTVTATSYAGSGANLTGIDTDLVSDTSPQLGGLLDGNGNTANFTGNTTGLGLPRGTTAQEPSAGSYEGYVRYNNDDNVVYYSDGSNWIKIAAAIPTLTSVTGNLFAGAASTLTLAGTNFLTSNLVVNFSQSSDSVDVDVTVTPSSQTAATVTVPASVYDNVTANNVVVIKVTNSDGVSSGTVNKTAITQPTGGTITTYTSGGNDYRVHTFTSSGNFVVTYALSNVDYVLVAGGGAGGGGSGQNGNGGGGAGGYLQSQFGSMSAATYAIVIGGGGTGTANNSGQTSGSDSTFNSLTSVGGGRGMSPGTSSASGGSGGGGTASSGGGGSAGTAGQGNAGGDGNNNSRGGGGGGGASAAGGDGSSTNYPNGDAGSGGAGSSNSIQTGSSQTYAGGGGGSMADQNARNGSGGSGGGGQGSGEGGNPASAAGTANTGGGGGAGRGSSGSNGGSGVVIVRYTV